MQTKTADKGGARDTPHKPPNKKGKDGCYPDWLALVKQVTPLSNGTKKLRLAYRNWYAKNKAYEIDYIAKPGSEAHKLAVPNMLFYTSLNSKGQLCPGAPVRKGPMCRSKDQPTVTCMYGSFTNQTTTPAAAACQRVIGIVLSNTPLNNGSRSLRFAFKFNNKRMEQEHAVAPNKHGFNARPGELYTFMVDPFGAMCHDKPVNFMRGKCVSATSPDPACEYAPPAKGAIIPTGKPAASCTQVRGVVTAITNTTVQFTYRFNGQRTTDAYNIVNPTGPVARVARKNQVWSFFVDQRGLICQDKFFKLVAGKCTSATNPDPACEYAGDLSVATRCGSPQDTHGLLTFNQPTGSGKCKLTFKYLNNGTERRVLTGQAAASGADCNAKPGAAYMVRRDPADGAWCGVGTPLKFVTSTYCGKEFGPGNVEICSNASREGQKDKVIYVTGPPGRDGRDGNVIYVTGAPGRDGRDGRDGSGGGGGGDGGFNLNLNIENQNKNENSARAGAGGGGGFGYGFGPHFVPTGGLYGPSFILPPEKVVVPVAGDTQVLGMYPSAGEFVLAPDGTVVVQQAQTTSAPSQMPEVVPDTAAPSEVMDDIDDGPIADSTPMQQPEGEQQYYGPVAQSGGGMSTWMWVAIALVVVVLLAGGFYLWKKRRGARAASSPMFL